VRSAFFSSLLNLAAEDESIFLLTGDVGFGVFEPFQESYPDRYINVGVAEANLTGVASGLALSGKIPFTYSIANFPTLRCLEQIRNDVCYNNANVKIVAVGGGLAYGPLGATHHATEDISIMRSLPNMVVMTPSDPVIAAKSVALAHAYPGPVYLRLGRNGESVLYDDCPPFEIGGSTIIREGEDIAIISTGGILDNVLKASDILSKNGFFPTVLDVHTVKPIDNSTILNFAKTNKNLFTVEEHSIIGGLGSAVAEVIIDAALNNDVTLTRIACEDKFSHIVGSQDYMLENLGLSPEAIADRIMLSINT